MLARLFILFAILFSPLTSMASFHWEPANWKWDLNPYVGIDGAWRHLGWEKEYGEGHFNESYQNTSPFVGLQLNKHISVEGGYQQTNRTQRQAFYEGNELTSTDPVLGFVRPIDNGAAIVPIPTLFISESEIKGAHLNAIINWPIFEKTDIYGLFGLAWMKFYVSTVPIGSVDIANPPALPDGTSPAYSAQRVISWDSERKLVSRIGGGIKQLLTPHLAGRVFLIWENTNKLSALTPGNGVFPGTVMPAVRQNDYYSVHPRNTIIIGIGAAYSFL